MSTTNSGLSIGLAILLLVIPTSHFTPMAWTRAGSLNIPDSGTEIESIESTAGNIAVVQFSVSYGALEFFLVHSDFYDLSGLPDVSDCQFHIIAQSASHQFTVDRTGTWYLVFANSPQQQEGTYSWNEYSEDEWNFLQIINWTIAVVIIAVISILGIKYIKSRFTESS